MGLGTIVCADTIEDVKAIAKMSPNMIVAEPTELIGTGKTSDGNYVVDTIKTVNEINPDIMVLQGAGISNGQDVYNTIKLGAQATGSTSGIIKADLVTPCNPFVDFIEMLEGKREDCLINTEECLRTTEICIKALESADSDRVIKL